MIRDRVVPHPAEGASVAGEVEPPTYRGAGEGRTRGDRCEVDRMGDDTRLERWLDRSIARAGRPRAAAILIASVVSTITLAAGILMTVIDHKNFSSIGAGLWWAVQTVTTVGYGDHVPETAAGQIVAAIVMLLGIGFVTVITASITGALVAQTRKRESIETDDAYSAVLRVHHRAPGTDRSQSEPAFVARTGVTCHSPVGSVSTRA